MKKKNVSILRKQVVSFQIPQQERINKQLDEESSLSNALFRIAIGFIPNREDAKRRVLEDKKKYSIQSLLTIKKVDYTGRTTAEILPEDIESRVIERICSIVELNSPLLMLALEHLKKSKELNTCTLSEHLFQSPAFNKQEHKGVIKVGLDAFFKEDYIAALSVLIPQIEAAVRNLINLSTDTMFQNKTNHTGGFLYKPLGTLLFSEGFSSIFDNVKDIPYYFQAILTDERGVNLRNKFCHSLMRDKDFNAYNANIIIHVLLILSLTRLQEESPT